MRGLFFMEKHYITEIQLCRELVRAIEQLDEQYRNIVPLSIWQPYLKLKDHYEIQKENGIQ
jgi:hypothetical protein